jgi:hypothetical protein
MSETNPIPVTKPAVISVSTDLLEAVAKWASQDDTRTHLQQVVFTKGTMVALDGHRMVIAPCETLGLTIGVNRQYLLAAIAAQQALKTDRSHIITIAPDGTRGVRLGFESAAHALSQVPYIVVPAADTTSYPPYEEVVKSNRAAESSSPDGYGLNPSYLADIAEVTNATCKPGQRGVKIVAWSRDRLGAMVFENTAGVRFFVMPMRI